MELPARRSNLASSQWADPVEFAQHHQFDEKGGHVWLGRSPLDGAPIGFADNRHVCLAGNTRGGKGTSIILPNICSWPGSMVVVDPKGENATVAAARRGQGSDFCEGMGQAVHILDPFNVVVGQDAYQSHFNPLDALDPEHPEVIDRAAMIADALVVVREDSKDPFWEESARAMVKALLLHIITWPLLDGERNLITLRDMVVRGDWLAVESLQETGYDDIPAAQTLLWQSLKNNNALNGIISGMGETYLSMMKKNPKGFDGVRQTVITNTEFLDSPGMRECLCRSDFELSELKTRAEGMSLFLSLPQRYIPTHFRWLRMMVSLVTNEMEIVRQQPATGHPMMMVLDEFAGLERMKSIENAVAQIAGYGVKLFFVLQSLEQLKAVYKDRWETFLANTGVKIFFGLNDYFSREYISKMLGETEVYRDVQTSSEGSGSSRTITEGTSEGESESRGESLSRGRSTNYTEGESYSESKGHSESRTTGESRGFSKSTGGSSSHSTNQNTNQSRNYGTNQGRNSSYGFGGGGSSFGSSAGSNEGSSFGSSSGHTDSKGRTFSKSFSINKNSSQTFGLNQNQTRGRSSSVAHGENESSSESITQSKNFNRTQSESIAESSNQTTGVNQVLHHRPLITPDEIGLCLSPLDDPSHPQYPGFALIVPSDGRATAVRRCNYYEDDQFTCWYDAHPDFPNHAPPAKSIEIEILWRGYSECSDLSYFPEISSRDAQIQWHRGDQSKVHSGEHIATVGPYRYKPDRHTKRAEKECGSEYEIIDVETGERHHKIHASASGVLSIETNANGRIGYIRTSRRDNLIGLPEDLTNRLKRSLDTLVKKYRFLKGAGKTLGIKHFDPSEYNAYGASLEYKWCIEEGAKVERGQKLADIEFTFLEYTLDEYLYQKRQYKIELASPRDGHVSKISSMQEMVDSNCAIKVKYNSEYSRKLEGNPYAVPKDLASLKSRNAKNRKYVEDHAIFLLVGGLDKPNLTFNWGSLSEKGSVIGKNQPHLPMMGLNFCKPTERDRSMVMDCPQDYLLELYSPNDGYLLHAESHDDIETIIPSMPRYAVERKNRVIIFVPKPETQAPKVTDSKFESYIRECASIFFADILGAKKGTARNAVENELVLWEENSKDSLIDSIFRKGKKQITENIYKERVKLIKSRTNIDPFVIEDRMINVNRSVKPDPFAIYSKWVHPMIFK